MKLRMSDPIHHIDKRKRVNAKAALKKKYQPYPHPKTFVSMMDHAVYGVSILAPIAGSTQAIKIWVEQTAAGVSLTMFGFSIIANIFLLTYGVIHRAVPIVIMYSLWFAVNTSIVAGILIYG
ncbi:MAG: hypothetical protein COU32_04150 [Candidatus Magasanikbacteria bacterium CG10_big_fil_rev_8_21_14_0_10_42_10]|uniref:Uncharacterized protein n=2 Tax=Candidatus Magasanikiibacteriota TaxID=1752731 RepID=A0A2H0TWZ9_9BACT|nr:MAG: hypothetical protein COU32_04150 [Candidatus Magasanikbacteria bacterium CG10_big_fil_rev_8_21_14_0_10_42_10]PIZ94371.1 MAG: hypothetical protein COX82_00810 [Candidatus Magasanikbacteria bacterium CG_4_10_14_0_2_um_filter_41_10]